MIVMRLRRTGGGRNPAASTLSLLAMRLVLLLPVLAGCQLVFALEDQDAGSSEDAPPPPSIERGENFITRASSTTMVSVARPTEVVDTDLVMVAIQSSGAGTTFAPGGIPAGFLVLSDGTDMCNGVSFHLWTLAGRFGRATQLDFTFTTNSGFDVFATPYRNASGAHELDFMNPPVMAGDRAVTFSAVEGVPQGTVGWLALVGNVPIDGEPPGMVRVGELDNITVYDASSVDGTIPEILVTIPATVCMGISQAKIEP